MSGRLITIEGGEGAGKSTAQAFIAGKLEQQGCSVVCTREPGGTPLAEAIRNTLLSLKGEAPVDMAELLLLFAARAQHLAKVIEPALARGQWVICDRFTDATFAYQGAARGLSCEAISSLESLVQGSRRPDAVVLMDLSPEIGIARARARGELDRFEQEDRAFYDRVRVGYLTRAEAQPARYSIVDASQPLDAVQRDLRHLIDRWTSHG
ncbi:MAG: dTMP kinase [Halieaceae bacterium]|nr:dTMP kinase [Halieaceae bacterium]